MSGITLRHGAAAPFWPVRRAANVLDLGRHRTGIASPRLAAGERVLFRESVPDGSEYVGTNCGLHLRSAVLSDQLWRHIDWVSVSAVTFQPGGATVTLRLPAEELSLDLRNRSRMPEFAAERVRSCQVAVRRAPVAAACTAVMTAHRNPADGIVRWSVRLDGRCDPEDPALQSAVDDALAEVRTQLGC